MDDTFVKSVQAWHTGPDVVVKVFYYEDDYVPEIHDLCVMLWGVEMPVVFTVELDDMVNIHRQPMAYKKAWF